MDKNLLRHFFQRFALSNCATLFVQTKSIVKKILHERYTCNLRSNVTDNSIISVTYSGTAGFIPLGVHSTCIFVVRRAVLFLAILLLEDVTLSTTYVAQYSYSSRQCNVGLFAISRHHQLTCPQERTRTCEIIPQD